VDLAHDETFARVPDEDLAATLDHDSDVVKRDTSRLVIDPVALRSTPTETLVEDVYEGSTEAPSDVSSEPTKQQEDYRAKVEALRQEFGSNWLSALGEQNWHNSHQFEVLQGQNMGHDALHRSGHHQVVVSGGRTLG
jgi:hypothetical protein